MQPLSQKLDQMSQNLTPRSNEKVIFICGAPHSGTTLLGLILGSHADCFYSGEANQARFLTRSFRKLDEESIRQNYGEQFIRRYCRLCGNHCPIWSDFIYEDQPDLYEQLSIKVQKPIIVDSTKDLDWITEQVPRVQNTSSQPFIIFLKRDGRAVVNSIFRKKPAYGLENVIQEWLHQIQQTQVVFDTFRGKKIAVRYEDLATNSEQVIQEICNFLSIDYQPQMLKYYEHEHHTLAGNSGTHFLVAKAQDKRQQDALGGLNHHHRGYYENRSADISLDLRWQQELTPEMLQTFEAMAGQVNQTFKWLG